MDLRQLTGALRKRWRWVALGLLLGIAGAFAANSLATTEYQATSQQFVSFADSGDQATNLVSGSQFTLQRVQSYTKVVSSQRVLDPVIKNLQLGLTDGELAQEITATNPLNTVLIQITVTNTDPAQAANIANAVSTQFASVIADIETPTDGGNAPVKITTTQPASVPTVPSSPRIKLNYALGVLVGLALGIGVALLREQLDTTIKTPEDLESLTGAVPLGFVTFDPTAKAHPLVAQDAGGVRAEAFRQLRTNLQFADVDHPPRVIVVTSPLSGDGKSTTACNIAITLGVNGSKVILIEADLRRPKASEYLGLSNAAGLTSLLAGQFSLDEVVVGWGRGTIDVLPSGPVPPNPSELLGSQHMAALIEVLRSTYDFVIIDAAPLLPVTDAAVVSTAADGAIIVTHYGRTTRDQAARAVQALHAVNARLIGTLLNFAPRRGRNAYGEYGYYTYTTAHPSSSGRTSGRSTSKSGKGGKRRSTAPAAAQASAASRAARAPGHLSAHAAQSAQSAQSAQGAPTPQSAVPAHAAPPPAPPTASSAAPGQPTVISLNGSPAVNGSNGSHGSHAVHETELPERKYFTPAPTPTERQP